MASATTPKMTVALKTALCRCIGRSMRILTPTGTAVCSTSDRCTCFTSPPSGGGASVAFCDRDGERGRRVAAELETAGAKIAFTHADVGTEAACLDFVNGAADKFGRLDILINNAGIRKYEKVDEASAASWNEIL